MRTVTGTLATAQSAASRTPYVYLFFTSSDGLNAVNLSTDSPTFGNRILLIDHTEEAYNGYATIFLRNYDRALPNLRGYWVEIGYGDTTGAGNEYSQTSRMWVKRQYTESAGGRLITILELEDMWVRLEEELLRIGDDTTSLFYYDTSGVLSPNTVLVSKTAYGMIEYIIETLMGWLLSALTVDDGIINTRIITRLTVNLEPFENAAETIAKILNMTKCYLRAKASLTFEVVYPQASDAVDITFYSASSPYFFSWTQIDSLTIPNHVYVFGNGNTDWDTNFFTGEALDQDMIDLYDDIVHLEVEESIGSDTDADNMAAAVLEKFRAENLAGKLVIPHDCRIELYDRVSVVDTRGT